MNTVICKLTSGIERTAEALIGAFGTLLDKPSGEMADYPTADSVFDAELEEHIPWGVYDPKHPLFEDCWVEDIENS